MHGAHAALQAPLEDLQVAAIEMQAAVGDEEILEQGQLLFVEGRQDGRLADAGAGAQQGDILEQTLRVEGLGEEVEDVEQLVFELRLP